MLVQIVWLLSAFILFGLATVFTLSFGISMTLAASPLVLFILIKPFEKSGPSWSNVDGLWLIETMLVAMITGPLYLLCCYLLFYLPGVFVVELLGWTKILNPYWQKQIEEYGLLAVMWVPVFWKLVYPSIRVTLKLPKKLLVR